MKLTTYKKVFSKFAEQANNASMREIGSRKIGKNNSYGATKSASLRKSLSVTIKDSTKGISATFSVKGAAAEYAPFIYYGVKGTKRNRGADKTGIAPGTPEQKFAYGNKQPPSDPIMKWLKAKPVRLRGKGGAFVKQTEGALKSAAYMIGKSIKEQGIYGLRWWDRMVPIYYKKFEKQLTDALDKDITIELNKELVKLGVEIKKK